MAAVPDLPGEGCVGKRVVFRLGADSLIGKFFLAQLNAGFRVGVFVCTMGPQGSAFAVLSFLEKYRV